MYFTHLYIYLFYLFSFFFFFVYVLIYGNYRLRPIDEGR